jgi:hypothetical protein
MPTYYSWSADKPCTTNEVYGFTLKKSYQDQPSVGKQSKLCTKQQMDSNKTNYQSGRMTNSAIGPKIINKGYVSGAVKVTDKIQRSDCPVGVYLDKQTTVANAYELKKPRSEEIFLWHSLAGNLVYCKNYPA